MSRLSVFSWSTSVGVHAAVLAVLGSLFTSARAERPTVVGTRAVISSTFTAVPMPAAKPLTVEAVVEPLDVPKPSVEPAREPGIAESMREQFAALPPLDLSATDRPQELSRVAHSESHLGRQESVAISAQPRTTQQIDKPKDSRIDRTEILPVEQQSLPKPDKQPIHRVRLPRSGPQPVKLSTELVENVAQASPAAIPQSVGTTETTPARPLENPSPLYPEGAVRRGMEGVVTLSVTIGADGLVSAVKIASSSGHRILDDAALDAVRNWEFHPATRDDKPVEWTARLPIRFRLK